MAYNNNNYYYSYYCRKLTVCNFSNLNEKFMVLVKKRSKFYLIAIHAGFHSYRLFFSHSTFFFPCFLVENLGVDAILCSM